MVRWLNPLGFSPLPVTILTVATYTALIVALLVTHHVLPPLPSHTPSGVNLTEAWNDLQFITAKFHPFNSQYNDKVREYLLHRITKTLESNGRKYALERNVATHSSGVPNIDKDQIVVIDDRASNVSFASDYLSVYFEGTNIVVSIPGTEFGEECYRPSQTSSWKLADTTRKGSVLVNAHYDSVSTGYGATDDGVGVTTVLQLLSFFTTKGNEPKRCIVLLLNNGEEDYLNGAFAFMRHPISQYAHTFLNLEGAGAGGRATLFRSTDAEVTKFYKRAKFPFGTVVSADGFKQKLVRSETDYVVFNGRLGLRGLDVAFMEPRAKYHTSQDSARETSMKSLWHMLSAAIGTVQGLASDTSNDFDGSTTEQGNVDIPPGNGAVWFDLFGRAFAVLRLHTVFALSVTLLTFTPILFIALTIALYKTDRMYLFGRKAYVYSSDDDESVQLNGWRGFFRFPITFVISAAVLVATAFLYAKVNPLIVYSSEYSIWRYVSLP
jgi:hypothetical protein